MAFPRAISSRSEEQIEALNSEIPERMIFPRWDVIAVIDAFDRFSSSG
jgi:hypothetical protein